MTIASQGSPSFSHERCHASWVVTSVLDRSAVDKKKEGYISTVVVCNISDIMRHDRRTLDLSYEPLHVS